MLVEIASCQLPACWQCHSAPAYSNQTLNPPKNPSSSLFPLPHSQSDAQLPRPAGLRRLLRRRRRGLPALPARRRLLRPRQRLPRRTGALQLPDRPPSPRAPAVQGVFGWRAAADGLGRRHAYAADGDGELRGRARGGIYGAGGRGAADPGDPKAVGAGDAGGGGGGHLAGPAAPAAGQLAGVADADAEAGGEALLGVVVVVVGGGGGGAGGGSIACWVVLGEGGRGGGREGGDDLVEE